jgi:hypothetical protein
MNKAKINNETSYLKVSDTERFKSWCSERMGHPMGVELGRSAVKELENKISKMQELLEEIRKIDHCRGGSLGSDGQFYYKVSESLFSKIDNLLDEEKVSYGN